jgi:CBS domain-containing protein
MKLVSDVMHSEIISCLPNTTIGQVAAMLSQHRIHAIVVTNREGKVMGIISDFDLLAGEWLSADADGLETMLAMTAGDLMSKPLHTIEVDATCGEAARIMRNEGIHRILVTASGKPVGVVSVSDLLADLARDAPLERKAVADVMTHGMLVCRDRTPVVNAARLLASTRYRCIVILDISGQLLGIVTGFDFLLLSHQRLDVNMKVSDVMTSAITISPLATLRKAADKMIEHHRHRLVVLDPNQPDGLPLGIISTFDIVNEMAKPGSVWQR